MNMNIERDIKSSVRFILSIENLRSKQDLNVWCGNMGKKKNVFIC